MDNREESGSSGGEAQSPQAPPNAPSGPQSANQRGASSSGASPNAQAGGPGSSNATPNSSTDSREDSATPNKVSSDKADGIVNGAISANGTAPAEQAQTAAPLTDPSKSMCTPANPDGDAPHQGPELKAGGSESDHDSPAQHLEQIMALPFAVVGTVVLKEAVSSAMIGYEIVTSGYEYMKQATQGESHERGRRER